ncbi:MAG TPA: ATPase domain-containing protein [Thermoplasmata archaeon]|nr:ATPase domain-containing protein [Thermoplasmata archaeon]
MTDDRISIGVQGLDEMLGGGIIRRRPYVISGTTGSGKTMLSIQFLQQGVRHGERSLLVAIDEPPSEIRENVRALGWDVGKIRILDAHPSAKAYSKRVSLVEVAAQRAVGPLMEAATGAARADAMKKASPDLSIQSLQLMLQQELQDSKYTRVVIDSLTSLKKLSESMGDTSVAIRSLLRYLSESGVTSLVITDIPDPTELEPEMFICRGEIRLHKQLAMGKIDRCVTIEKLRGSAHDMYPRPVAITEKGISVDPRRRIARSLLKELQGFTHSPR